MWGKQHLFFFVGIFCFFLRGGDGRGCDPSMTGFQVESDTILVEGFLGA